MDNVTYKSNLIKVEVYYEEFNFQAISQDPAYEVCIHVADIGT
jgi:Amiloride-sensitive sodium channel